MKIGSQKYYVFVKLPQDTFQVIFLSIRYSSCMETYMETSKQKLFSTYNQFQWIKGKALRCVPAVFSKKLKQPDISSQLEFCSLKALKMRLITCILFAFVMAMISKSVFGSAVAPVVPELPEEASPCSPYYSSPPVMCPFEWGCVLPDCCPPWCYPPYCQSP